MKFNPDLKKQVEKFRDYVIVVEGKKDVNSLSSLGFGRVFAVHQTGVALRESVERISKEIGRKEKVCILTDLDKKGKKLYLYIKPIFQELGVKVDSTLRGILIKSGISHIEGLNKFMKNIEGI